MTRLYTNMTLFSWSTQCADWRRLSQRDTPRLTRERRCVGSRMTPIEGTCRSYESSPGAFDNSHAQARKPASTIRSCTSSKPPNLNHHLKSCSVDYDCWKSCGGYRQRSVPVTGLSCRRWKNIKRSSARSVPSPGPQCGGSQTCASWREIRQTGNSVQWRRSACPSASGRSKRCPCPTTGAPSTMRGQKGGGGATRKRQAPGRESGAISCKCCGRNMVSRPQGPRGSLPGPPCTEASGSWWAGRNPTARRWHSWRRYGAPTQSLLRWGGLGDAEHAQSVRVSAQQLELRPGWPAAGRRDRRTQESHDVRKSGHNAAALGAVAAGRHRDGRRSEKERCSTCWVATTFVGRPEKAPHPLAANIRDGGGAEGARTGSCRRWRRRLRCRASRVAGRKWCAGPCWTCLRRCVKWLMAAKAVGLFYRLYI